MDGIALEFACLCACIKLLYEMQAGRLSCGLRCGTTLVRAARFTLAQPASA